MGKNSIFKRCSILFIVLLITGISVTSVLAQEIARINVRDAKLQISLGKALLVCSYNDDYCSGLMLPGAILISQLEAKTGSLAKNSEIIFYCA